MSMYPIKWVFARLSTAEERETEPPLLRLGTGADVNPGAYLLLASGVAVLPLADLALVDPGCVSIS